MSYCLISFKQIHKYICLTLDVVCIQNIFVVSVVDSQITHLCSLDRVPAIFRKCLMTVYFRTPSFHCGLSYAPSLLQGNAELLRISLLIAQLLHVQSLNLLDSLSVKKHSTYSAYKYIYI